MRVGVPDTLLQTSSAHASKPISRQKKQPYIYKRLKRRVRRHLVVDPICRNRVIRNILHICLSEIQRCIEYCRTDTPDDGVLLSLDVMELLDEATMMGVEFAEVVEDVGDKLIEALRGDYWGVGGTEGADVHL